MSNKIPNTEALINTIKSGVNADINTEIEKVKAEYQKKIDELTAANSSLQSQVNSFNKNPNFTCRCALNVNTNGGSADKTTMWGTLKKTGSSISFTPDTGSLFYGNRISGYCTFSFSFQKFAYQF